MKEGNIPIQHQQIFGYIDSVTASRRIYQCIFLPWQLVFLPLRFTNFPVQYTFLKQILGEQSSD